MCIMSTRDSIMSIMYHVVYTRQFHLCNVLYSIHKIALFVYFETRDISYFFFI
jgi:hypothetical protein